MGKAIRRGKNPHNGGQQLPLIVPDTDWTSPAELPDLRRVDRIALDRETRDLWLSRGQGPGWVSPADGHVCGVSLAWREDGYMRSMYAPINHPDTADCFTKEQVRQWEIDHAAAGVTFVMQNASYDVGWGQADLSVPPPPDIDDTSCMAYMIDEQRLEYNLDALCSWRGLPKKDERLLREAAEAYRLDPKKELWKLPARFVGPYAAQDAESTLMLCEDLEPLLEEQGLVEAYQLEMDLVPMVHEMRRRGIRVDTEYAEQMHDEIMRQADQIFSEISEKIGQTMGIDECRSNEWLTRTHDALKVSYPRDEKGRGSFEKAWMARAEHWLPRLLQRGKSRYEAADKFIRNYILGNTHNGRVHASINQWRGEEGGGTKTYRFSYSEPPLQQLPKRDEELSAAIRGCLLPEEGELWSACDYSQQEYRLMVHYAMALNLSKAHEAGYKYNTDPRTDFHSMVAQLTGLDRKPAKDCNFAKAYGAGAEKFALMIGKSVEEARTIMGQYDQEMPFISQLNQRVTARAQRVGYVKLLDGARIRFPLFEPTWIPKDVRDKAWSSGIVPMAACREDEAKRRQANTEHPWHGRLLRHAYCHKAMNALIQGGAARQTKMAMRECWRAGHVPLLQVHDELGFSVGSRQNGERVAEIMRDVVRLNVPMMVDAEYGKSFGDAKHTWEEATSDDDS